MKLTDIPMRTFQGVLSAAIATADANGTPNATFLSQVFYVDERHVALSHQFFNKTKRNVGENPYASVVIHDPVTLETYRIDLRFDRSETEGPLFERMSVRIDAIASQTGMTGIFRLVAADVYEVLAIEKLDGLLAPPDPTAPLDDPPPRRAEIPSLQLVAQHVCRATDLDGLLSGVLEALEQGLGFEHSMVLLCDESAAKLFAIASRGYGDAGIGAEVAIGQGFIGTVARERCVLRVAGVGAELRYGRAIRASVHRAGGARSLAPEIPLPGLVDAQSQLALPLVARDRLVGVIAVESPKHAAFEDWHEAFLEIIASHVAAAIENVLRLERDAEPAPASEARPSAPRPSAPPSARARRFRFYAGDDCVFADDEYLVRNVPGKILWKLLRAYAETGRVDFTNRELRLDPSLGLPAIRDNLESRLVLLRKRLAQKCPDIALVPTGRGQFRLEVACAVDLCDDASP